MLRLSHFKSLTDHVFRYPPSSPAALKATLFVDIESTENVHLNRDL